MESKFAKGRHRVLEPLMSVRMRPAYAPHTQFMRFKTAYETHCPCFQPCGCSDATRSNGLMKGINLCSQVGMAQ